MRKDAQCVIIGGGAMGVGLLYHLAHEGWTDTILIEKGELTSGSTWHAAGLVPHFIGSLNMAKVHAYGAELAGAGGHGVGGAGGVGPAVMRSVEAEDDVVDGLHERSQGADVVVADEVRSEERRVGKECRSRWSPYH